MISILLSLLISATPSDASSNGYSSYDSSIASKKSDFRWEDNYGLTDSGLPFYSTKYYNEDIGFSYNCYVTEYNSPGEAIAFVFKSDDLTDPPIDVLKGSASIKVFAHTNSGYKLISGRWEWSLRDGIIAISRHNEIMDGLAEPLSKIDMENIFSSNYFKVSIDGMGSTVIGGDGIKTKIINTWSKCNIYLINNK
jgi:hypothetical protein